MLMLHKRGADTSEVYDRRYLLREIDGRVADELGIDAGRDEQKATEQQCLFDYSDKLNRKEKEMQKRWRQA